MSAVRVETLDLCFQGAEHVIAAFLVRGPGGPVLVETGPGSTLAALLDALERRGVAAGDVRDVLVTHIHLDHAGAAGWWARQGATVRVHPAGAPHLVDPSKLLASAARIYGDRMDRLWGEMVPAPSERVVAVEDGETIEAAGLCFRVVETTGHAWHHHAYVLDDAVFAGDAAGIKLPGDDWVDLPAPPPEFDLEAWKATLARLRGLDAGRLYRTHFDAGTDVAGELDRLEATLEAAAGWIRQMLEAGAERSEMVRGYGERMRGRALVAGVKEADAQAYELANPRSMSVDGIARYWRKRLAR